MVQFSEEIKNNFIDAARQATPGSVREIGVPAAFESLFVELDRLQSNINVLTSRLSNALLPDSPQPAGNVNEDRDIEPSSHLRNSVQEVGRQVHEANTRLCDLLERLDI
jgi:hypothetical protein